MITLILTRHGETDLNVAGLMSGQSDVAKLTKNGIAQAKGLGKALLRWDIDLIYSSTLKRARRTAEIINESLGKEIIFLDDLRERNWGVLEGESVDEVFEKLEKLDFQKRFRFKPEGGESWLEFEKRLLVCLEDVVMQNQGKTVLLVSHGGVVKVLIPLIKKLPREETFDLKIHNTSLTIFKIDEGEIVEELINDIAHLEIV